MESYAFIGSTLGGLGLFLLAIGMMTDGLKLSAGRSLRKVLSQWSKTPIRGIFSGLMMTALVQSSSAVTVATLGFVNAGLISMRQTLGIIYGANIGTTMTGWLVALVGFKLNIESFALPLVGIGMLLRLIRPQGRAAAIGLTLVGFGLFFIGIDVLKSAFEGVVASFDISQFKADGIFGVLVFLLVGIVMTILTQSSSAAIALTITAASSGMIGVYAAASLIIGANIGTTSTVVIASIGATSYAKRVAAAQVVFNVATAIVALIIMPLLIGVVDYLEQILGLSTDIAITLALFHTVFNLLGVFLVYPHNDRLVVLLEKRFITWQERDSKPRFLDKTVAETPVLAVNAISMELGDIAERIHQIADQMVTNRKLGDDKVIGQIEVSRNLCLSVSSFIVALEREKLSEETTQHLSALLRIQQYYLSSLSLIERVITIANELGDFKESALSKRLEQFLETALACANSTLLNHEHDQLWLDNQLEQLQLQHDQMKLLLLEAVTRGRLSASHMSSAVDFIGETLRVCQLWTKAAKNKLWLKPSLVGENIASRSQPIDSEPHS